MARDALKRQNNILINQVNAWKMANSDLQREIQEARRELDELRDNYAVLQRLYEVTNPPDNNLG